MQSGAVDSNGKHLSTYSNGVPLYTNPRETYPDGFPVPTDAVGLTVTVGKGSTAEMGHHAPTYGNGVPLRTSKINLYPDGQAVATDVNGLTITVSVGETNFAGSYVSTHANGVPLQTRQFTYADGSAVPTNKEGQAITVIAGETFGNGVPLPTYGGVANGQTITADSLPEKVHTRGVSVGGDPKMTYAVSRPGATMSTVGVDSIPPVEALNSSPPDASASVAQTPLTGDFGVLTVAVSQKQTVFSSESISLLPSFFVWFVLATAAAMFL